MRLKIFFWEGSCFFVTENEVIFRKTAFLENTIEYCFEVEPEMFLGTEAEILFENETGAQELVLGTKITFFFGTEINGLFGKMEAFLGT